MKIMGLDFGTKRIGVAISDGLLITAQGQESIVRRDLKSDLDRIKRMAEENDVSEIVVGLPLNMNGTHSAKSKEALEFVENLSSAIPVSVKTWDERLTSVQAERALLEGDMSRAKRRKLSDKLAAQIILQNYLDCPRTSPVKRDGAGFHREKGQRN